jgi:hypothetical protein
MQRNLRIVSLVFALISVSAWVFLGANRGWTRTSVATRTVDEVTGIEGIQYRKRFVPGVDLLGGALMVAGLMAFSSLFLTHEPKKQITQ